MRLGTSAVDVGRFKSGVAPLILLYVFETKSLCVAHLSLWRNVLERRITGAVPLQTFEPHLWSKVSSE